MAIDWKTAETTHGLLVACVATNDKLDLKRAAQLLSLYRGEEVTYNAIENRMRVVKREATQLKERLDKGEAAVEKAEKPQKAAKPKPKKDGVISGRVEKSTSKGKKGMARKVQKTDEAVNEAEDSGVGNDEEEEGVKTEPEDD